MGFTEHFMIYYYHTNAVAESDLIQTDEYGVLTDSWDMYDYYMKGKINCIDTYMRDMFLNVPSYHLPLHQFIYHATFSKTI